MYKIDNTDLLWDCTQYSMITYMKKEYEKDEYMYMYNWKDSSKYLFLRFYLFLHL